MKLEMFVYFAIIFLIMNEALTLICHRKECTNAQECLYGWDTCNDKYCYLIRAKNTTNPYQFNLRRGCIGDPPLIKYSNELAPFSSLNQCQKILWKDIEFLIKICADTDYCNFCETWVEAIPLKSNSLSLNISFNFILFLIFFIFFIKI
uniref:Uncharacterized protein n=1 Tax=Meloidogyne enterolobii TaxID=390850 RepID=A0A6V7USP0_MELEN|nr:unnamed protein product [Meloidogyne enterolobii]